MWRHKERTCCRDSFPRVILLGLRKILLHSWNSWIMTHYLAFQIVYCSFKLRLLHLGLPNTTTPLVSPSLKHFTSEKLWTRLQQVWTQFSWLLQKSSALVKSLWDSLRTSSGYSDMPFQGVTSCKTLQMKMSLTWMKVNLHRGTHLQMNCFTWRLVLTQDRKATRKWPIETFD